MRYEFTPAAERALVVAAGWRSCANDDALGVPEVLLGLLAEPECRAALILAQYGVDAGTVQCRCGELRSVEPAGGRSERFSPELVACFEEAERRLIDYPRPLVLATEYLLLGIAGHSNSVSRWLAECGLDANALEAEVHRLSGHQPGPLPLDPMEEETIWIGLRDAEIEDAMSARDALCFSVLPQDQVGVLRVIDAAANRAGEGLRVIEDYLRFVLDDRHLTAICKDIRHELTAALAPFSSAERHAARETQADVGTDITLATERLRAGTRAVLEANFKRVEQSLRSLEEFSKTLAGESALAFEQLRYRVYTLERATDMTRMSLELLADARLYVLVDARLPDTAFQKVVLELIAAGVSVLQLREKNLPDRQLLARARLLRELSAGSETLFIMNDRADLAGLADADGVHLGQDEISVKDARQVVGTRRLIGVSTHSVEQARAAVLDGANYIGVGPTFPSSTKEFSEFTGETLLGSVAREIRLPAFAIGGINAENLPRVLAAGFHRIAVSGAIWGSNDPARAARQLLDALNP